MNFWSFAAAGIVKTENTTISWPKSCKEIPGNPVMGVMFFTPSNKKLQVVRLQ